MLTDFNLWVASLVPDLFWDAAQFVLGTIAACLCVMERHYVERFQTGAITCYAKWLSVRAGQIGLAMKFAIACLVAPDAIIPPISPPRTLVVLFLVSVILVQIAGVHTALQRRHTQAFRLH